MHSATNDIVRLAAKHPTVWPGINSFERLLAANSISGHNLYPGLGLKRGGASPAAIWKARVLCKNMGGKRSGLRYIYERISLDGEDLAVGLYIYLHAESATKEPVVQRMIKQRFDEYELTAAAISRLERAETAK